MSSIIKGLVDEQGVEETKKLSAQEKFKRSMKRAGYDMDAGAKRLQDLLAKQKKEREEFEKKEKEIKEGPAVDAYMAGKSPAIAHFADRLDNIKEDETLQFAAEVTPKISPYAGVRDNKFRGAIGEGIKQMFENPNESPTDSGYQQGGWRKMNEQEVSEDLRKWFKEKWVRFGPDGKIRGACARGDDSEGKPKCLPQAKAHALGKKGRKYAAAKKRREDPNPERSGPAKNVATKKKSNESLKEFAPNFRDDGDGDSRDIDRLREKIYSLLMHKLANVEGDPQDIAMAAMEVADDIASESEFVDITKLPKWIKMVLNKVQGVAEANSPEEFLSQIRKLAGTTQKFKIGDWVVIDPNETSGYASSGMTGRITNLYNDEGEKMAEVAVGGASGIQKKMKLGGGVFGPKGMELDLGKGIRSAGTKTSVPLSLLQKFDTSMDEQGVAEGSEKNVVKSVRVGDFRHDLVDTGFGWQVRIYNGDELYDTGMSKNSEQKGLAALEDAVAYTEKQTRTKRQGVAEGSGNWYIRVRGKVLKDKQFNAIPFPSKDEASRKAFEIHNKKRIPIELIKLTQSWMDGPEQGVAEGYTGRETKDGTWRVFKDGKAVAVAGPFKSREEAAAWIKKQKQGVAEGFSDISGLLSASNLNKSFIITAELAEGGKKKFRVKAQNERVAIEKFKKHHSMAKIINVAEEGVEEGSKYPRNPASYHLKKYPVPQDQLARPVKKEPKKPEKKPDEKLDELKCWSGYTRVKGVPAGAPGSCKKKTNEEHQQCPECGGAMYEASLMNEKKDACYYKVKSRYKVWPSAYASGALVKCRKKGAKNWGSKSKSNEGQIYSTGGGAGQAQRYYTPKDNLGETKSNILFGLKQVDEGLKSRLAGAALAAAMAAGGSQAQNVPTNLEPSTTIEKSVDYNVNRNEQTVEYKGKKYNIVRLSKDGPQPRIARFDAKLNIPMAELGYRGYGTLPTTLAGDSAYVYLP